MTRLIDLLALILSGIYLRCILDFFNQKWIQSISQTSTLVILPVITYIFTSSFLNLSSFILFFLFVIIVNWSLNVANFLDGIDGLLASISISISMIIMFLLNINDVSKLNNIIFKEHPLNKHYEGVKDEREWMFYTDNMKSFFNYWKKCRKFLLSN